MTIVEVGNVLYIREMDEKDVDNVKINFPGVADGTVVDIFRESDNKYHRAVFKKETALFSQDFFLDSLYSIRIKAPDGTELKTEFVSLGGKFERAKRAMTTELSQVWEALIAIDEKYKLAKKQIDELVLGYTTE